MKFNATRLALLMDVLPGANRVAVLGSSTHAFHRDMIDVLEQAAQPLGLQLRVFELSDVRGLDDTFSVMTQERLDGLLVLQNPLFLRERQRVAGLALRSRLPSIYDLRHYVDAGGLMSYGPKQGRPIAPSRVAGDLATTTTRKAPTEQPAELVINLRIAHILDLTIPPAVLARADEVIE